jgi:ElaA protein
MKQVMDAIAARFGKVPVRISAQSYLINFYRSFGFVVIGEEYLEDDIPHTEMLVS